MRTAAGSASRGRTQRVTGGTLNNESYAKRPEDVSGEPTSPGGSTLLSRKSPETIERDERLQNSVTAAGMAAPRATPAVVRPDWFRHARKPEGKTLQPPFERHEEGALRSRSSKHGGGGGQGR